MPTTSSRSSSNTILAKSGLAGGAEQLLLTGERLFAEHGIDDVSMRQIVVAAGQANSYAIQHHFGSKSGLIRAILERRLPQLDARMDERLKRLRKDGQLDARSLLGALMIPIEEFTDSAGKHVFAQFLLRDGLEAYMAASDRRIYPAASQLSQLLNDAVGIETAIFDDRLYLVTFLYLHAIVITDQRSLDKSARRIYLDQAIDMGVVALKA